MKKQHLWVLILVLNVLQVFSQTDFREGYLINKSNDTIYGLIDYKGNRANAMKCVYKKNIHSNSVTYTPEDINGYRFKNSKYYVSKSIVIDNKPTQLFLEYLINGIVDIYYYMNYNDRFYFISDENDQLHELKINENEFHRNGKLYKKDSKEYIGVLKYIFQDSPKISKETEKTTLNHKSLINISLKYHNEVCKGDECIIYEKKVSKTKQSFGILTGINLLSHAKSKKNIYYTKNKQFGNEFVPSIGVFYKINIPYISEKTYFQYEGTYSNINLKTSTLYIEPTYRINYLSDKNISRKSFNNSFNFRHEYIKGRIKPTFQLGMYVNYFFKKENNTNVTIIEPWSTNNENYRSEYPDNAPINKYEGDIYPYNEIDYGIHFGIGLKGKFIKNKDFFIDLKYQRGLVLQEGLYTSTFMLNLGLEILK
ncbi:hypothetical protein AXE80_14125 [Wenyingzhuangia fucanilytica]|uniref:Outer membrane protein beta-barrel domain-containing protein n=1 Tax=Wenyingzhuangia fucanilytica TaxID=1790137 RepID=A0A1B1Y9B4_9FLAO|nr:hypothetical protein [Wenyingzhuangia fucanilytica]ANW97362.1 hypothetical protein AXE80_14125 [Wenyingzhuangia fucanilytica]